MKLVIVESPTKAKTLSQHLSKDYEIKASMGHIRDLPKSGLGVDVENNYEPVYEVPIKAKKVLADIKKSLKEADEVVLATDPDREGEAIAWHLKALLEGKKDKKVFSRAVFHELTKSAIEEAFKNIGEIDLNLVDAQQARRVLDRLVGYKLSPLLWKKVRYGLSAGRVQSVAVRLIVERERERESFKSEEYWDIKVDFMDAKGKRLFTADLTSHKGKKVEIKNKESSENHLKSLKADSFVITEVKKSERKKKPYAPFKTSTLQQSCSNVFGFTAKKTMMAAQKLFEKGFITYHRTDSLNLSSQFVSEVRNFVSKEFGKEYLPEKGIFYKTQGKNAQEAHEAIRVTDVSKSPKNKLGLVGEELKVYSLIWRKSIECQMEAAVYDQTSLIVKSEKEYGLRASGSIVKFPGWLIINDFLGYKEEDDEMQNILPEYKEDEKVMLKDINPFQHFTQPPGRYSDATLIKKMEEIGVGRPSTYAPTISTIQSRGYVEKDGRYFVPQDVAFVVTDLLVAHFKNVVDYNFTAQMEEGLDEIAEGKREWVPLIRDFYVPFEKELSIKDKELNKRDVTNLGTSDELCPDCGKPLVFKLGKYGKFLSCSDYPECKYAKPLVDTIADALNSEDLGKCPECKDGVFVLKQGRFGKFLACSNYPKCKTTKPYLEKIGMKCPKCNEGDIIVKKARGRKFFGCSRYPDCDYSSWKDPRSKGEKEE